LIDAYFQSILAEVSASPSVYSSRMVLDKRSSAIGLVRGEVHFLDGSLLHFREFVNTDGGVVRYMYVYHYQRADQTRVFRYDNTDHFPDLVNVPHHKHLAEDGPPISAVAPDLAGVLKEIEALIETG
jgi:hypothetical protein